MKVSILHSNNYSPNEIAFLYPLYKYNKVLKNEYRLGVRFSTDFNRVEGDVAILSSKSFSQYWRDSGFQKITGELKKIRTRVNHLIWYDISDSTGTTHFKVLPYVDKYLKNQILKDKKAYLKNYYGDRIYADYIHRHFNITDTNPGESHLCHIPDETNLDKIMIGWHSGMAYYGQFRHLQNKLFSCLPSTLKLFKYHWHSPHQEKSKALSCRIGVSYTRNTIAESRQIIRQKLSHSLPTDEKLSHKEYFEELRNSRSVLSPFGLGEISLRDFEVIMNGGAMIKQDMSHLNTWPNLWIKDKTYLSFKWDMSDLNEQVDYALSHSNEMMEYALEAQEIYKKTVDSEESAVIFCERFHSLIQC